MAIKYWIELKLIEWTETLDIDYWCTGDTNSHPYQDPKAHNEYMVLRIQ